MSSIFQRILFAMSTAAFLQASLPSASAEQILESRGDHAPVLVELYTSEGCSSCPPAEAWLNSLKASPDLWSKWIPLAFHVDYWNGLGWPDRFAKKTFTDRQRQYAAQTGSGSVYTPEFIVNGSEWRGWSRRESAPPVETSSSLAHLRLALTSNGQARVTGTFPGNATYQLSIALLGFNLVSDVRRGENSGRTLRHDFVVLYLDQHQTTTETATTTFDLPSSILNQSGAIALWAVDRTTNHPIASLGGWLQK